MDLHHLEIANFTVSAVNERGKANADVANMLPPGRARGILVPLMVSLERVLAPAPSATGAAAAAGNGTRGETAAEPRRVAKAA